MPNLAGRAGARKAAEHGARTVAGARYKARQDRQDSAATERRMKQFQARQEAAPARRPPLARRRPSRSSRRKQARLTGHIYFGRSLAPPSSNGLGTARLVELGYNVAVNVFAAAARAHRRPYAAA